MSLTLKNILDAVLLESGMDTETVYATASQDEVKRLVNLANRSAVRLATAHNWQALRKTYTFSMTAATEYDLPEDFRALIPNTTYVDSNVVPVNASTHPGTWGYLQAAVGAAGPRYHFRWMNDKIHVYSPQSGESVRLEYLSNYPIESSSGTRKQRFDADTDVWVLDDDLLTMDVIWRYKKLLGLEDWQADYSEFSRFLNLTKGQESSAQCIIPGNGEGSTEPYTDLWVNNS